MDLSRFQKISHDLQIQTLPLKEVAFMCRVENFQKQSEREELTVIPQFNIDKYCRLF